MSAALMWLLIVIVGVTSLLCNSGAWLWMAAKWCRIPNVSYLRALATMLLIGLASLLLRYLLLNYAAGTSAALAFLALDVVVATVFIRQVLRTTARRALAAGLITLVISGIVAIAFVIPLKLYVMESFVLPTGSMAPAVIGRHFDMKCERCGRDFCVSATTRYQNQQRARGRPDAAGGLLFGAGRDEREQVCRCPNCRIERPITADRPNAAGDKILVDKIGQPRRWDVVVFRYPENVSTNYVKRLIGLPGEKVEIIAGDVFINDSREVKPYGVAHDLWIPVNDTRFHPSDLNPQDPQWKPEQSGSKWSWEEHGWTFSGTEIAPEILDFSGTITDESAYAEYWSNERLWPDELPRETGDVQVKCTLMHFSGEGPLGFRWKFHGREALASVAGNGDVELRADNASQVAHLPGPLSATKNVAFAVRDGVAMLVADNRMIAALSIGPQDAESSRAAEDGATEPCRIALTAGHCRLELARIVLERDVFYRNLNGITCSGCTGKPITLKAEEHYVLGDHSGWANDSRLWQTVDNSLGDRFQAGTVPAELMIGVVRSIYWPPARCRTLR